MRRKLRNNIRNKNNNCKKPKHGLGGTEVTPLMVEPPNNRRYNNAQWEEMYNQLVTFREIYGHTQVRKMDDEILGSWVQNQRSSLGKKKYEDNCSETYRYRIQRLDSIDFYWGIWDPMRAALTREVKQAAAIAAAKKAAAARAVIIVSNANSAWDNMYELLVSYKRHNGHVKVTPNNNGPSDLAAWLANQEEILGEKRKRMDSCTNTERSRIQKLESLGVDWHRTPEESAESTRVARTSHLGRQENNRQWHRQQKQQPPSETEQQQQHADWPSSEPETETGGARPCRNPLKQSQQQQHGRGSTGHQARQQIPANNHMQSHQIHEQPTQICHNRGQPQNRQSQQHGQPQQNRPSQQQTTNRHNSRGQGYQPYHQRVQLSSKKPNQAVQLRQQPANNNNRNQQNHPSTQQHMKINMNQLHALNARAQVVVHGASIVPEEKTGIVTHDKIVEDRSKPTGTAGPAFGDENPSNDVAEGSVQPAHTTMITKPPAPKSSKPKIQPSWDVMYTVLVDFKNQHGHMDVKFGPKGENRLLSKWVKEQKRALGKALAGAEGVATGVTAQQLAKLDAIGFFNGSDDGEPSCESAQTDKEDAPLANGPEAESAKTSNTKTIAAQSLQQPRSETAVASVRVVGKHSVLLSEPEGEVAGVIIVDACCNSAQQPEPETAGFTAAETTNSQPGQAANSIKTSVSSISTVKAHNDQQIDASFDVPKGSVPQKPKNKRKAAPTYNDDPVSGETRLSGTGNPMSLPVCSNEKGLSKNKKGQPLDDIDPTPLRPPTLSCPDNIFWHDHGVGKRFKRHAKILQLPRETENRLVSRHDIDNKHESHVMCQSFLRGYCMFGDECCRRHEPGQPIPVKMSSISTVQAHRVQQIDASFDVQNSTVPQTRKNKQKAAPTYNDDPVSGETCLSGTGNFMTSPVCSKGKGPSHDRKKNKEGQLLDNIDPTPLGPHVLDSPDNLVWRDHGVGKRFERQAQNLQLPRTIENWLVSRCDIDNKHEFHVMCQSFLRGYCMLGDKCCRRHEPGQPIPVQDFKYEQIEMEFGHDGAGKSWFTAGYVHGNQFYYSAGYSGMFLNGYWWYRTEKDAAAALFAVATNRKDPECDAASRFSMGLESICEKQSSATRCWENHPRPI